MPYIAVRNPLDDAKDTFSSWDKCMAKSYCKWPVIVVIVLGILFIVSLIFCIYRCGKCLTCCWCCNCCSCCAPSGGGSKGHKRMESGRPYPQPYPSAAQGYNAPIAPPVLDSRPINQQYRSHATPMFTPAPEAPQYATFESSSKPVNEDSLPAMPSWSEAKSTRVEEIVMPEKKGDLEMDRLDHNGSEYSAAAVRNPRTSPGPSPVQRFPSHDTYGFPPEYQNDSFVSAAPQRSQHSSPAPYGGQYNQREDHYRGGTPVSSLAPAHTAGAGYGRQSPLNVQAQQYGQSNPRRSPGPSYNYEPPINNYSAPPTAHSYNAPAYPNEPMDMPSPVVSRYDNSGVPAALRAASPQYAPSGSTNAAPAASYPGQQTYGSERSYPGQPAYQAFQPQETGVARHPAPGGY